MTSRLQFAAVQSRLAAHTDLTIATVLAVAGMLAVFLELPTVVRIASATPLVLCLPGYVLTASVFPGPGLAAAERILLSIGLSIAVAILGGLFLGWTVGITPTTWGLLLGTVTLLGVNVVLRRRRRAQILGPRLTWPGFGRIETMSLILAIVSVIVVVTGIRSNASIVDPAPPAALWMLPVAGHATDADLGMRAGGLGGDYTIRLVSAGELLQEFKVSLVPSGEWQTRVAFSQEDRARPIVARLYEDPNGRDIRFVVLQPALDGDG